MYRYESVNAARKDCWSCDLALLKTKSCSFLAAKKGIFRRVSRWVRVPKSKGGGGGRDSPDPRITPRTSHNSGERNASTAPIWICQRN